MGWLGALQQAFKAALLIGSRFWKETKCIAAIGALFDHLVGDSDQRRGNS